MQSTLQPTFARLTIRPMMMDDLETVVAIDQMSFTMPWPANSYRYELLENQVSRSWVAEVCPQDGKPEVVGVVVTWIIEDEAHIATIAVHPAHRGVGIGKQLLLTVLRECADRGVHIVTLEVREHNEVAISLYRQFEFEVVGRRRGYYKDTGEDALIMTRVTNRRVTESTNLRISDSTE
jgi:ribosomal-protein-alanine N-acetyltransferase